MTAPDCTPLEESTRMEQLHTICLRYSILVAVQILASRGASAVIVECCQAAGCWRVSSFLPCSFTPGCPLRYPPQNLAYNSADHDLHLHDEKYQCSLSRSRRAVVLGATLFLLGANHGLDFHFHLVLTLISIMEYQLPEVPNSGLK